MKKQMIYWLAAVVVIVIGCQKELSFEGPNTPAKGTLQDDVSGDCLPKTVNGVYTAGVPLVPATNTISVQVNVTQTGTYDITTDTVNGYFFHATGTFIATGLTNVTLRSNGTPFANGINNFVVSFDGTICDIQVTVTAPGVGTLAGTPGNCAPISVAGAYSPGITMNSSNNATVQVNVTTAGLFNITTDTIAGIWFNFSGTLATGNQSVTLQAHGSIPSSTTPGANTFTVKLGTSQCKFIVIIAGPAVFTLDGSPSSCSNATVYGVYVAGTALDGSDSVVLHVTTTVAGAYNVNTGVAQSGMVFAGTGTLAVGPGTITLVGTGSPTAAGPTTINITVGTTNCSFSVYVLQNDYFPRTTNSNWSTETDGNPTDSLLTFVIAATNTVGSNTYNIFMQQDGTAPPAGDSSGYYRRNNADYFQYFDLGQAGFDNTQWIEYTFLKDNQPAGTKWVSSGWTNAIGGTPITFRLKDSVESKDITITGQTTSTGTKNYSNVIVITERIELFLAGTWQDASGIFGCFRSYYARGIGYIKGETIDPPGTGAPSSTERLRRWVVF